jgi:hypothetical protein
VPTGWNYLAQILSIDSAPAITTKIAHLEARNRPAGQRA